MIRRLVSLIDDASAAPSLRRHIAARESQIATLRVAVAEAGTALREERADHAWLRERHSHAPTPETAIEECWTLGGSDAALAMAMWGRSKTVDDDGVTGALAPTLADLGAIDASEVHRAKGCGTEAMRRAARTLALAGVEAHPSWARWLR